MVTLLLSVCSVPFCFYIVQDTYIYIFPARRRYKDTGPIAKIKVSVAAEFELRSILATATAANFRVRQEKGAKTKSVCLSVCADNWQ